MIDCYPFQRALDNLTSFHEMLIKSLFKFVQGAAHMWDLHEIGLARQERRLQVQYWLYKIRERDYASLSFIVLFFSPWKLAWLFMLKEIEPSPDRKMATDIW